MQTIIKEIFRESETKIINTKFGKLEYSINTTYWFEKGIFGFDNNKLFTMCNFPLEGALENFMLFQSLENMDFGFLLMNTIVGDHKMPDQLIDYHDLLPHLNTNNINLGEISVHLVVSIQKENDVPVATVNLQSPIILNPKTMQGWQFLLDSNKYKKDHVIK
jgi:flagellar assembly factor FliW